MPSTTILSFLFVQEEAAEYGIDWQGPAVCSEDELERVVVPGIPSYLDPSQLSFLKTVVNPLEHCDDHGRNFYVATRQLVREILSHD